MVLLAFGLLATPLVSQSQPQTQVARIGWLRGLNCSQRGAQALREGLRDLGYVEGQHMTIEERCNKGLEEARASARDFVQLGVDLLLATGPEFPLHAANEVTRTMPIVFFAVDFDPLAKGYIDSLARPGGHITGVVALQVLLTAKRLEMLKKAVPSATRVAVFWDAISADQLQAAQTAAQALGLTLLPWEFRQLPYDFTPAFRNLTQARADALLVLMSPYVARPERARLPTLAMQHRLPAIFGIPPYVAVGGLMAYGVKLLDLYRHGVAAYVDRRHGFSA
jgi:putative ABC transport system substrate-binding protein